MAGTGAASSILCTTPLEAGCRRPYKATEPTASAHQRSDPVGIVFCTLRRHRVHLPPPPIHAFPHPRRRPTAPIPPDGAARPAPDLPRRSPTAPPSEIAAFRRASSPRSTTIPPTPLPPSPPPTFPPSEQRHPDRSGATFPAHDTPHLSTSHADTRIVILYSVCVSGAMQFSRG